MSKLLASVSVAGVVVFQAAGFPSWMGTYSPHVVHDGGNPGTFTILMNQDYSGLHSEVSIQVNGGGWIPYTMGYVGNVDGNSKWEFVGGGMFPPTQLVEFYFHGWDDWGGDIWDSNSGANYSFYAGHNGIVQWIGNTYQFPADSDLDAGEDLWINMESWPPGAGQQGSVYYTFDGGRHWQVSQMTFNGQQSANDHWSVNLGSFPAATVIRYAVNIVDYAGGSHWDNSGGADFFTQVNYDPAADEDGDAVPNGWELANGQDPNYAGDALRDSEEDGLVAREEYKEGVLPSVADTDLDGVLDGIEAYGLLTDPASSNNHSLIVIETQNGSEATTNMLGLWDVDGTTIFGSERRGWVEYDFDLLLPEVYLLEVELGHKDMGLALTHESLFSIYVDGQRLRTEAISTSGTVTRTMRAVTPYLTAGTHSVRVVSDNSFGLTVPAVSQVSVLSIPGPDLDANGIKDWTDNWLIERNGIKTSSLMLATLHLHTSKVAHPILTC